MSFQTLQPAPQSQLAPEDNKDAKLKWLSAGIAAVLFVVLASPFAFKLVNSILTSISSAASIASPAGLPSFTGLLVHGVVFLLLARLLMEVNFYQYL